MSPMSDVTWMPPERFSVPVALNPAPSTKEVCVRSVSNCISVFCMIWDEVSDAWESYVTSES